MSFIGRKILHWKTKWSPKNTQRVINALPYHQAATFGLLYGYENSAKEEAIQEWIQELKSDKKEVQILCVQSDTQPPQSDFPTLTMADMNVIGKIQAEVLDQFLERSYDYFIHLDFEGNEVINMIVRKATAQCKIGFHSKLNQKHYDLMIGVNKHTGIANFTEQIMSNLKRIK